MGALLVGLGHSVTSVFGIIGLVCGTGTLMGMIPPPWSVVAMGVCGIANGLGLLAAPDANKVQPKV